MPTASPPPFVKAATIVLAITLMSGFVLYRTNQGAPSSTDAFAGLPIDSPDTKRTVKVDSFHMDE